jgi:Asp-tRNA(Asn)/Glu-tRNA(Gln) amidotransferase A subunit family amidase
VRCSALDAGSVTSVELVEMHLDRIAAVDGDLQALAVGTPERPRESRRGRIERVQTVCALPCSVCP